MLEAFGISVNYGKRRVLDEVSVEFERGMLTSVVGVNGCGKSTLLRALLGLVPRGGSVMIDGADASKLSRVEIARRVSYLAQGKDTPDMTVMELVLHGRFPHVGYPRRYSEGDREIASEAMARVGIAELCDEPLKNLSGGMRQCAYIAMALAQNTDYMLLDEPTTYLDVGHQMELLRLLRGLCEGGKGVVAVMHDLPLAMSFSDRVAVLDGGAVRAFGTPREVISSGVIEEVFGISIGESGNGRFYVV